MNIAAINTVNYGSTGKIMLGIHHLAASKGYNVYSYFAIGDDANYDINIKRIGKDSFNKLNSKLAHVTGLMGFFSFFSTLKLIKELKKNHVDLIHLHNIHVSFLNFPLFFRFIKRNKIKVVWTLHDCWTFTGHCPHFTYPKCDKWKTGCYKCERYKEYPISSIDNSRYMYHIKKSLFNNIENCTLVVPSLWLKNLVSESFLKEYNVEVINNGIDLEVFKPCESQFRKTYNIEDKIVVLGVAFDWGIKKGLDVFIELSKTLDPNKYVIVLVGVNEKLKSTLPSNIISINKTYDAKELAEIYTAADIFLNPTREEVFGLVNVEANACGTPVIMFNTGGSPECITDKTGKVVDVDDFEAIVKAIEDLSLHPLSKTDCIENARNYNLINKYLDYINLYKNMSKKQ